MVRVAATILIAAVLALPAFSAAAAAAAPVHSKRQAEHNVLKTPFVAAYVEDNTRAICTGVGRHVGARYSTFECRVTHFQGGLLVVRYIAGAAGNYRVVLS